MKPILQLSTTTPSPETFFASRNGGEKQLSPLPSSENPYGRPESNFGSEEQGLEYPFPAERGGLKRARSWWNAKSRGGYGRRVVVVFVFGLIWLMLLVDRQTVSVKDPDLEVLTMT